MVSRRGIYYDLTNSIHRTTINQITYVFSSKNHLLKFKDKHIKNRYDLSASLSNRFGILIDVTLLADIVLYTKVETRGFLIITENGVNLCKENLVCNGEKLTLKS
jgi:YHS domain-containing protein